MQDAGPSLYVTNLNPRFTGVSATAAAVLKRQAGMYDAVLVGHPLPGCPAPITLRQALQMSRRRPDGRAFAIWHVRRNIEMQFAILARDVLRLPIRIVFTSAAQRRHSAWPRWLIRQMDAVIATTEAAASFVPGVWAVVPHGVDTDRFAPANDPAAAWRATGYPGDYGIVAVGRIRPEKGTDLFVEAMISALPHLPGATALVVGMARSGEAEFLRDLKDRIAQAGLAGRILFPGEVPADRMPALLQGCRALVALPRYEGYGLTPLEAMATGLPIVASDTGHFREFIGGIDAADRAGAIVPTGDHAAAAKALVAMLSDASACARLSANARARAVGTFGIAREAEGIADVYERLWAQAKSHQAPPVR
jgi:mannosyltransferase